jgi:hypothetical protein
VVDENGCKALVDENKELVGRREFIQVMSLVEWDQRPFAK